MDFAVNELLRWDTAFTFPGSTILLICIIAMLTFVIIWFYFRDASYTVINRRKKTKQRKMAKEDVQKCLEWLLQTQNELETSSYGVSKAGITEASSRHRARNEELKKYRDNIQRLMMRHKVPPEEVKEMTTKYDSLSAISSKRGSCIEVLDGIVALEGHIQNLASEFDTKTVHLVNLGENNKSQGTVSQSNESMARAAQNCHTAVRGNWRWVDTMLQCAQVHLRNSATYHEFFHEVDEVEYWMDTTLSRIHLTFDRSKLKGQRSDVSVILDEMKDMLLAYLQWQTKVDSLFDRAKDIVPIPQRIESVIEPRPVLALSDFKTNEIQFEEGETLTLLDNSKRDTWLVQNQNGQSCMVPAVIILIPAPSGQAVDAALRLRLQLLALWTTSIKRLGYQMIAFMTLAMRDWTEDEIKMFQSMSPNEKKELLHVIQYIEDTLLKNWNGYSDFEKLQEKILQLKMILENSNGNGSRKDPEKIATVIVQIKSLETLLNKYKDFWAYWETFKVTVELLREPKFLLVCDKWDQLKYTTSAHFIRFWDTDLHMDEFDDIPVPTTALTLHETPKEPFPEGDRKTIEELQVCQVQPLQQSVDQVESLEEDEWTQLEETTTTTETTTDQVISSVEEEKSTFVITGIIDPRDDNELTLQEAILLGILDQTSNTFHNPDTGETMTIKEAMNYGYIMYDCISRKKIREEKKSYGILTIKTSKENRPFTITNVIDPGTEEELSLSQATSKGIINTHDSTYKTENDEIISIHDAIQCGLVKVEFQEGNSTKDAEVVSKSYAVHGVTDQQKKQKVSFTEAVSLGLIDKESGEYVNNVTKERMPVSDAIIKGFIKARVVTDSSKLDIDPENRVVIEKYSKAKNKLVQAMKVSKAFSK